MLFEFSNLLIVLRYKQLDALVWQKVIFLSPPFNQLFLDLFNHISSSMANALFNSNLVSWMSSKVELPKFIFSNVWSFCCKGVTSTHMAKHVFVPLHQCGLAFFQIASNWPLRAHNFPSFPSFLHNLTIPFISKPHGFEMKEFRHPVLLQRRVGYL